VPALATRDHHQGLRLGEPAQLCLSAESVRTASDSSRNQLRLLSPTKSANAGLLNAEVVIDAELRAGPEQLRAPVSPLGLLLQSDREAAPRPSAAAVRLPIGGFWRSSLQRRSRPSVFSLVPRCHGACGSQKCTSMPASMRICFQSRIYGPGSSVNEWQRLLGSVVIF
jgi:hypothetical protein